MIREKRMDAHMSQKEVCEKLHMNKVQYSKIETGKTIPSVLIAIRIAEAINCKVEEMYKIKRP